MIPSTFPLARKFHWGQLSSPMLQSTWERWLNQGTGGVLTPAVHTKGSRLSGLWGAWACVTGPQMLCLLLPLSSPQVGFLRFLFLIATFDWKNNPLIVNLNNEFTGKW